jgi:hypothetical protein
MTEKPPSSESTVVRIDELERAGSVDERYDQELSR